MNKPSYFKHLCVLAITSATIFFSCDNAETASTCDDEACNTACLTAGYPSGVCSGGDCECISHADGDSDIDGDSDNDADEDSIAVGDGDARDADEINRCAADVDCDDGLFCNSTERCDPTHDLADEIGCVRGAGSPCPSGASCMEEEDRCVPSCDTDLDGDGVLSESCGGDDCDDLDDNRFPGNDELCDPGGLDEDCDPLTLGPDLDGDGYTSSECSNIQPDGSLAFGRDCNDNNTSVHPDTPESCNGIDDNCNSAIDETFDCSFGSLRPCTTDCATPGTRVCTDSCVWSFDCRAPAESCNAVDDDCDGFVDEDFLCILGTVVSCHTECGSIGSGLCSLSCLIPSGDNCDFPVEFCNGADDDCDGVFDEDFECIMGETVACTTICGSTGIGVCSTDCLLPSTFDCSPLTEICNAVDDDCDGVVDEGFACIPGEMISCTTTCSSTGSGLCVSDCSPPDPVDCTPPSEVCNGDDDNCDGRIDEGFHCPVGSIVPCLTMCGSTGAGVCTNECTIAPPLSCAPPSEVCNGIDDNCDGYIDEGYCSPGSLVMCVTTCGSEGTGTCTGTCEPPLPVDCLEPEEVCNGIDDDCDADIDESCDCAGVWTWENPIPRSFSPLRDIWISQTGAAFAVGWDGTVLQYDGSSWGLIDSIPVSGVFNSVWGRSDTDVFVVGDNVVHYDGTSWTVQGTGSGTLQGVTGSTSTARAYVVGEWGYVARFNGTTWVEQTTPTSRNLMDIWLASDDHIYAVGAEGTILHGTGSVWSLMSSGTLQDLYGVWSSSSSSVYSVGNAGTIIHYNGTQWSNMNSGVTETLYSIWGTSDSDIIAVGSNGIILHYDGSSWEVIDSGTTDMLWGVSGSSSENVMAVSSEGNIFSYNGVDWIPYVNGRTDYIMGIWGNSWNNVIAVGADGMIQHYDGTMWAEMESPTLNVLFDIWSPGGSTFFAVGYDRVILRYDGTSWLEMINPSTSDLRGIWGTSEDSVFAAGGDGTVLHYDGTRWNEMGPGTSDYFNDVWGFSDSDVWVVGMSGNIWHYDGVRWSNESWGASENFNGIWGAPSTYLFMVSDSGWVYSYDGTTWVSNHLATTDHLMRVWGTSDTDVFVVGLNGAFYRYNGIAWRREDIGTPLNLRGIWSSNPNNVFVGGRHGTLLHYCGY